MFTVRLVLKPHTEQFYPKSVDESTCPFNVKMSLMVHLIQCFRKKSYESRKQWTIDLWIELNLQVNGLRICSIEISNMPPRCLQLQTHFTPMARQILNTRNSPTTKYRTTFQHFKTTWIAKLKTAENDVIGNQWPYIYDWVSCYDWVSKKEEKLKV